MDARAKIEEMLKRKREGADKNSNKAPENTNKTQPNTAANVLTTKAPFSALERINEMLKQKQIASNEVTLINQNKENSQTLEQKTIAILPNETKENTQRLGLCPSCVGDLAINDGLYVCIKCKTSYVRRGVDADLINCKDLPYGYCKCCEIHFPLVKTPGSENLICSISREKYLFSAQGYLQVSELPFGLCSCCQTPNPLVASVDRSIRCIVSNEEYIRNINGTIVRKPIEMNLATNNDIEAALNQGNAAFYYGGFIGGQEPEPPPVEVPKRQRRRWFL
ncbi:MAG: hypothetical protein JNM06_13485 [Blastocatellia bacterium]|nr:hypothetical protein [Blastocatellia bacterium]